MEGVDRSSASSVQLSRRVPSRYWPFDRPSHRGIGVASRLLEVHMRKAAKRELIDTESDKRYVRRDERGQFKESEDVGRASAGDQKRRAKQVPERGQGDRGDRNLALNSE